MSNLASQLGHLKNHVEYPASRAVVVAACNGMADIPQDDRQWFTENLPEGNYRGADDVVRALLAKV